MSRFASHQFMQRLFSILIGGGDRKYILVFTHEAVGGVGDVLTLLIYHK